MRQVVQGTDCNALMAGTEEDIARVTTFAMFEGTDALVDDWRDQIRAAGLGNRLANTVKGRTYPIGQVSQDPASWVYSKAAVIVDAFDRGPTVFPVHGQQRLAIPTDNVPRRRRKRMTPVEVEAYFNQDLIIRPGRRGSLLAFVDVLLSRSGKTFRPATKRRLAQGRQRRLVLMFVLVRQVRIRKRLDLQALADRAANRFPTLLDRHWQQMGERTAKLRRIYGPSR